MAQLLSKKQIAAQVGIDASTMRRNRKQWSWLEKCKAVVGKRPVYSGSRVRKELEKRGLA